MSAATGRGPLAIGAALAPTGSPGSYGSAAAADLAAMAEAGLGAVRLYVSWPAVEPQVGRYDDVALDDLAATVAEAHGLGLAPTVCLFADLGDGRLLDLAWAGRRDLRTDDYVLERASSFAGAVAARLAAEPSLEAWLLADEAFLHGFASSGALERWARLITDAVRERDPDRPLGLGADTESLLVTSGIDARAVADRMSLAAAAATPRALAAMAPGPGLAGAATHCPSFLTRLARKGLPVAADGLLPPAPEHSLPEVAGLVRMRLYGALADGTGSAQLGPWRPSDAARRVPFYRGHGESLAALLDEDGGATPALGAATLVSAVTSVLGAGPLEPLPERVAVLVPAQRYGPGPLGLISARSSLAAFSLATEAHLPVDVIREGEGLEAVSVLIVPSARGLEPETWAAVTAFVAEGGTLVASHGGAEPSEELRALAGVDFTGEAGPRDSLTCRIAQPLVLGDLTSFEAPLRMPSSALLAPGRATVIAADGAGRPLVTVFRSGRGRVYFVSAPLERAIGDLPHDEVPTAAAALVSAVYRAAASSAGAAGPVDCDRRSVRTAVLTSDAGPVLVLVNHAPVPVTATLTWERRVAAVTSAGGARVPVGGLTFRVPIAGHDGVVLRIEES